MDQPSLMQSLTGITPESPAEQSARELCEARVLAVLLVARVIVISAWGVVVLAALVILFGAAFPRELVFSPLVAAGVGLVFALVALFVGVGVFGERRDQRVTGK